MVTTAEAGEIRTIDIEDEMRSSYLDYAMSVIVSRALPDVRDGLKPVQRRILYAMHDQGMRPTSSYKKSARLVGDVLGKYHPHSDTAVYDALVRMAQPFSMRNPLVDGQGNYGSVDGDPPAAMRYTECRLAPITEFMLGDIEKETVDWQENFDQSLKEPTVLPALLPNLLVNGASGIAVGMATNIPPHNVAEICDAVITLTKNPDATVDDLMRDVKGPDFPTGAHIWGSDGIRNAYTTGKGRIVVQATGEIEDVQKQDRKRIVFTEIPFQVNKSVLIQRIAELIKTKRVDGVSEVRDESDRRGMRIVLELRRSASPAIVMNNLFKHTPLRTSFSVNMIGLVHGAPHVLTLKQVLQHFIDFREEVVRRRAEYELKKAKARLEIIEGLLKAIEHLDRVIQIIRTSESVDDARNNLMAEFGFSRVQAQAILDMQLRRLAALERQKLQDEHTELIETVARLEALLADPDKVKAEVVQEARLLKRRYGGERRTVIHTEELGEFRREDIEPHEDVVITLSNNGYIKRVKLDTYRKQHRGGKGVSGQRLTKDDDVISFMQVADTHDTLLFFTDHGRVFSTRVFELPPEQSRQSRGTRVQNLDFTLNAGESVRQLVVVNNMDEEDAYMVMATDSAQVKRVPLSQFKNLNRRGLNCYKLLPKESLVSVAFAHEDDQLVMVTRKGQSICFASNLLASRSRTAGGVRGIRLSDGDRLVGMDVVKPDGYLLILGDKGRGKLSAMRHYPRQNRGGSGVKTLNITRNTGNVAAALIVDESLRNDETGKLMVLTAKGQIVRTPLAEIRETGRSAQGVKIVTLDETDAAAALAIIDKT